MRHERGEEEEPRGETEGKVSIKRGKERRREREILDMNQVVVVVLAAGCVFQLFGFALQSA